MTGPRPAGRPWTPTEQAQLREFALSRVKVGLIAKILKRSPGAVFAQDKLTQKICHATSRSAAVPLAPFRASGMREGSEPGARALTVVRFVNRDAQ